MTLYKNIHRALILLTCLFVLAAPLAGHARYEDKNVEIYDPIESVNRAIYEFNDFLDMVLFKPIAKGYRFIVPKPARKGLHNALKNLNEPVTLLNSVLQGDMENSATSFWRFTINSTLGVAGLFDVAKHGGLPRRTEDFGQTAGVYGAGPGAYLMLPILGPSNGRDLFGRVVDGFTDPFNYALHEDAALGRALLTGLDAREGTLDLLDEINRTSLDPYAAIRSLYTQRRADEIRNGKLAK